MRTNFIMHFHCSECGEQLELEYEPKYQAPKSTSSNQKPQEPTGVKCYYNPKISIKPCGYCIKKYTEPAKNLLRAIEEIKKNNND